MTALKLIAAALIPVIAAVILFVLEKRTAYGRLKYGVRQMISGVVFGVIACLATEFGIISNGFILNVRNAAPLTAGIIFGGPAGIIAGLIGGIYRAVSVLWAPDTAFTWLACSIAAVTAGLVGACTHRFMQNNKKASWLYGLLIGGATEVFHMLLLFITKPSDSAAVFEIVSDIALTMTGVTAASVMLSLLAVFVIPELMATKGQHEKSRKPHITHIFQTALLITVFVAFAVTISFNAYLQNGIFRKQVDQRLQLNLNSATVAFSSSTIDYLVMYDKWIAEDFQADVTWDREKDQAILIDLVEEYGTSALHFIGNGGIIYMSTSPEYEGKPCSELGNAYDRMRPEHPESIGREYYYQPYDLLTGTMTVIIPFEDEGMVIIGHDAAFISTIMQLPLKLSASNRPVGETGFLLVADADGTLVSSGKVTTDENGNIITSGLDPLKKETLSDAGIDLGLYEEGVTFEAVVYGVPSYCRYIYFPTLAGEHDFIAVYPVKEAEFSRDLALYMSVFMETLVYTVLFMVIYRTIKKVVILNLRKVNGSLSKITAGNLNTVVDVRDNAEFNELSNDINSTVDTLKHYIDEAKERIDNDLKFAKNIQVSALPRVFPPFPNRKDFDIYATMDAAKEVGGDFFDFFLLDKNRFGFLVADVSGKSIPGAMFMMRSKTIIKSLAETGMEVNEILQSANANLCEENDAGMFVTVWIGIIDMDTGMLTYANAGHNHPLIRHKGEDFEYLKTRSNFILAGMPKAKYRKNEYQLRPGDELFLYTDGVTEATDLNEELFGDDRLKDALNSDHESSVTSHCKHVKRCVDEFVGEADQFDDITMLSVKLNFFESLECIITDPTAESTDHVWNFINKRLSKTELSEKAANRVRIVVDEVYSNILRYSKATGAKVFCTFDEKEVLLVFEDDGMPYDPLAKEDPDTKLSAKEREIGGLGIFMVKKLSSRVEYEYKDGKNILRVAFNIEKDAK